MTSMRGVTSAGFLESRAGVSTRIIAGVIVVVIILAAVAGYLALKPSSSSKTSVSTTAASCGLGTCVANPVSGVTLYNDYQLSGIPANDATFTGRTIYAQANITSIITYPLPQKNFNGSELETGVNTNANDFEYWYWGANNTNFPTYANEQLVTASCLDLGLTPQGNGSFFLYLDNCQLLGIKT